MDDTEFHKVGLIAKRGDPLVGETVERLALYLSDRNCSVLLDQSSADVCPNLGLPTVDKKSLAEACDLAIIVGGDGTFLNAARALAGGDIRLLGVNMGRLGFLADISPAQMNEALERILAGDFVEEARFLLEAQVVRNGASVVQAVALNDVVAHKWHIARLLQFETFIDSQLVNSQRSDGLIVSTPTGSTAYALSSGGPILHPSLDALVLVPICPHTLGARPIVVDGSSQVEIVLTSGEQPEAQLTCDGQTTMALADGDRILISKRSKPLYLVHPPGHDYYATLRAKLHWGGGI